MCCNDLAYETEDPIDHRAQSTVLRQWLPEQVTALFGNVLDKYMHVHNNIVIPMELHIHTYYWFINDEDLCHGFILLN